MRIRFSVGLGMNESISYSLDIRRYHRDDDINSMESLSKEDKVRIHNQIDKVMNALTEK